jgi:peptidylprolyl isomerase
LLVAGCGSSSSSSSGSIAVGNENPHAAAEVEKLQRESEVSTPKSGPLSKEPKVTPPSGPPPTKLVTKELVEGKGKEVKEGDMVTVNYVGVLYKNGKIFNNTWETKEPVQFTISAGSVIPGWAKGIPGMHVGSRRELIIPAAEAYGKAGQPPTIPPNSALVFVVDVLAA